MEIDVNIVGSSVFGRYNKISSEKTYNMFISDNWLVNFAGWQRIFEFFPIENAEGRGIFRSIRNDIIVVVVNNIVYKMTSSLFPSFVGTISTSSGPVFMDENLNNQVAIVDGLNCYIYNYSTGSLTKQSLSGDLIPNYVTYHNTFFLFGNGQTGGDGAAWYAYSYASPTSITETTQLALQTKPDFAIAVERIPGAGNNVIVFGTAVAEVWTQVGGINNYQRLSYMNIDYGCLSVSTIASSDKYVIWLGINESNSPVITLFTDGQVTPISTDGIDFQLGELSYPEQSTAFFFRDDGHLFYQLTFYNPDDNLSLIYDIDTKKFFHISDSNQNYHPARRIIYLNNNIYFISLNNGGFYQTGTKFTTYNENIMKGPLPYNPELDFEIPRIRICASIRNKNSLPFLAQNLLVTIDQGNDDNVNQLELSQAGIEYLITEAPDSDFIITETGENIILEFHSGFSGSAGQMPYCPRVDLTISKDGGVTFSNTVGVNLNPVGKRKNILRWARSFGLANDLTFKFHFWGTSYWCVFNGTVDVS